MTTDQWAELVEWVAARFPDRPWAAEQAVAFYYDLQDFDATDVWAGLYALYEEGQRFAPNGSQLLHAARKQRRKNAIDDVYRQTDQAALPEGEPMVEWGEFSKKRFDEVLSPMEFVARIHAESTKCRNSSCDIHNEVPV